MKSWIVRLALIGGAALAVTGCVTDGYGGYGYSGLSYGYASPGYGYGWYDDYYYPGTGYYVYERSGARHRWNDSQRRYWQSRRGDGHHRGNWSGYRDHSASGGTSGHHDGHDGGHRRDGGHRSDHGSSGGHRGSHDGDRGGDHSGGSRSHGGRGSDDGDGRHHRR